MLTLAWIPSVGGYQHDDTPNPTMEFPTAFCRAVSAGVGVR